MYDIPGAHKSHIVNNSHIYVIGQNTQVWILPVAYSEISIDAIHFHIDSREMVQGITFHKSCSVAETLTLLFLQRGRLLKYVIGTQSYWLYENYYLALISLFLDPRVQKKTLKIR